ncbi:putative armadillo-like helical protein [Helianthus annuus]|nr:putative armadillo-like helical protein [Helianthus annuus]
MLSSIVSFAKLSGENRESVAKIDGFVPLITKMFKNCNEIEVIEQIELVIICLDLILPEKGVREQLVQHLVNSTSSTSSSFTLVLRRGGLDAKISAARVLESLASFDNESRRIIADQSVLIKELYNLTSSDAGHLAVDAGIAALIAVYTSRHSKKEIVRLGIVKTTGKLLSSPKNSVTVVEIISTCTEGRTAICEDEICVPAVIKRLTNVSPAATEHGIGVIWSVLTRFIKKKGFLFCFRESLTCYD